MMKWDWLTLQLLAIIDWILILVAIACAFIQDLVDVEKPYPESIGNNTRLLYQELEKLKIYCPVSPIQATDIKNLVESSTTSSLTLAKSLLQRDMTTVYTILHELITNGENYLKIVSTLTTYFRQWLTVKALIDEGVNDNQQIASAASIGNPNRIYYLRQEVANISLPRLIKIMEVLLETEILLKQSNYTAFTSQILKICSF